MADEKGWFRGKEYLPQVNAEFSDTIQLRAVTVHKAETAEPGVHLIIDAIEPTAERRISGVFLTFDTALALADRLVEYLEDVRALGDKK